MAFLLKYPRLCQVGYSLMHPRCWILLSLLFLSCKGQNRLEKGSVIQKPGANVVRSWGPSPSIVAQHAAPCSWRSVSDTVRISALTCLTGSYPLYLLSLPHFSQTGAQISWVDFHPSLSSLSLIVFFIKSRRWTRCYWHLVSDIRCHTHYND